jgi:hypothetical protein
MTRRVPGVRTIANGVPKGSREYLRDKQLIRWEFLLGNTPSSALDVQESRGCLRVPYEKLECGSGAGIAAHLPLTCRCIGGKTGYTMPR